LSDLSIPLFLFLFVFLSLLIVSLKEFVTGFQDQAVEKRHKTMETDVFAYGCLYYATFFDSAPFNGKTDIQIVRLVTNGKRPARLESPSMEDDTWRLIERCWEPIPSERLMIKDIVTVLASRA